ncbi:MAG: POTRA domain-containing protein [Fluviicola sp.]
MDKFRILLLLLLPLSVIGQKSYVVDWHGSSLKPLIKHPTTQFKDSLQAAKYIQNLRQDAINDGFLLASIDSVRYSKNAAVVSFYLGNQYESALLQLPEDEISFVRRNARLSEKVLADIPLTPKELGSNLQRIHNAYLNNGYPLSSVQLDSVIIDEIQITANIKIERGPLFTWKEVHIKGDTAVSQKYLTSLIGISEGDVYSRKQLTQITGSITQVPFIKEIRPHEILLTKEGAELFVYVESVAISSFNGVVGLQPDPISERLQITGDLNLRLMNVLKRGELLNIRWQSIRDQTQSLTSRLNYPFLFGTSFGIDGKFDLYKRDTSFLELNGNIGVQYFLSRGNYIKAYYQTLTSSVLAGGANNPTFSNLGNTQSNNYGLAFSSTRVDYFPNPSRGFRLEAESSIGSRTAQRNDSAQITRSTTYRGMIELEWFVPIYKRHILRLANNTEFYIADEIFQNEVFRFGGLTAQRGFNEDELLATTRTSFVAEYRFLLDKNSHVFAFYDQTWYENVSGDYFNDTPFGFGLGFSFRTNLGVFSISYALGSQFDAPIQFNSSKVHFGYIAYF